MVIAHHLIWTVYGTWLPNDPRGSGSRVVISPAIAALGELHYGRRKIQPKSSAIREFYERAEPQLMHPIIRFTPMQLLAIGEILGRAIQIHNYTCYACAVMPDHVHLVIRKHRDLAEEMIDKLQETSLVAIRGLQIVPADHPVWTSGSWKRFLDTTQRIHEVVQYVENNPLEVGLPRQLWPFVVPYDDWPFHKRRR